VLINLSFTIRSCAKNEVEPLLIAVRNAALISSSLPDPAFISYIIALNLATGSYSSTCISGGK
jgi:hypothetical protein